MRVAIALLFFAPIVAMIAIKNGAEQILPIMMGMSLIAIVAYFIFDRKEES